MKFSSLPVVGCFLVELEAFADERGLFGRTFCQDEFRSKLGVEFPVSQCSTSYNRRAGTLRGMHYQRDPYEEKKLVRCTRGRIHDVIVDLRPASATFLKWASVELSAENRQAIFMPEGVAHGFQTLEDDSEIFYQMSVPYHPGSYAGVRWNDPAFGIQWPQAQARVLSEKDATYPDFRIEQR